jgi:sarcosine oxidase subunit alpha
MTELAPYRLLAPAGLYLDRARLVTLKFEGKQYDAFAGDTVASALLAHGVQIHSRSFKYHRPRGVLTMAGDDAGTFVQFPDAPNVRGDVTAVPDGVEVAGQNYWGSLMRDRLNILDLLARFMPVGFYYRAFYKPRGAWRRWETLIRHLAGLGEVNLNARAVYFDKQYRFADVAVIGGGAAGLEAALAAADAGAETTLIDDQPMPGGSLSYARFDEDEGRVLKLRESLLDRVGQHPRIEVLKNAKCTGWFEQHWLAIALANRLLKLRAKAVVIATGSLAQPMVFRNNDLPGVMLGTAAQRLIRLYGVRPGRQAVIATANDDGYGVALDLADFDSQVAAIVDLRHTPATAPLANAAKARGIPIFTGHTIVEAIGRKSVRGVRIAELEADGQARPFNNEMACDCVCISVGYSPAAQLTCHSGGSLVYDSDTAMLRIDTIAGSGAFAAGSVNQRFAINAVLADGRYAGSKAAEYAGFGVAGTPSGEDSTAAGQNHHWPIFPHPKGKDFVDLDEDLTVSDIVNAVGDGFEDLELVKRYSTAVMGPSQGRHSALNTLRIATHAAQRMTDGMRLTTQRPPFSPEPVALLAGRCFQPVRHTAMHRRHIEAGARMMPAGLWLRPAYYGEKAERDTCIASETHAVRDNVGIIDVSTLGKLDIRGPDAAEFLERVYTFRYAKQPVGRLRYVLMTDSAGAIIDDGVACRISEQHFYVTATTGGVDGVYRNMLRLNAEWRLHVDISNGTTACSGVNVAGPNSRTVLQSLVNDLDMSAEAFPYLGVRDGKVAGIPARLMRVGFVGELGYEIHAPAGAGEALWDALLEAGAEYDIRPVGVEAQRRLRLEKGHIIVGQDTDGLTIPQEVDMAWAVAEKPFFTGQRAIEAQTARPLARQLVGFKLPVGSRLPQECNLTLDGDEIAGRVTSIENSAACGHPVGLAYVRPGMAATGERFEIKLSDGQRVTAEVAALPFYDPDNERQEL